MSRTKAPYTGGPDSKAIGDAIKFARGELTQAELATKLRMPQTTISRWERGTTEMTYDAVRRVEGALGVPFGSIGVAAGYIGDELANRPETVAHVMITDLESVIEMIRACDTLGLGVRLETLTGVADGEPETWWRIEVLRAGPAQPTT